MWWIKPLAVPIAEECAKVSSSLDRVEIRMTVVGSNMAGTVRSPAARTFECRLQDGKWELKTIGWMYDQYMQ